MGSLVASRSNPSDGSLLLSNTCVTVIGFVRHFPCGADRDHHGECLVRCPHLSGLGRCRSWGAIPGCLNHEEDKAHKEAAVRILQPGSCGSARFARSFRGSIPHVHPIRHRGHCSDCRIVKDRPERARAHPYSALSFPIVLSSPPIPSRGRRYNRTWTDTVREV